MQSKPGTQKVTAGAVGGAIATVLVIVLEGFGLPVATGLEGALATLATAAAVYLMPEKYT